jgi:hypothetical protein
LPLLDKLINLEKLINMSASARTALEPEGVRGRRVQQCRNPQEACGVTLMLPVGCVRQTVPATRRAKR